MNEEKRWPDEVWWGMNAAGVAPGRPFFQPRWAEIAAYFGRFSFEKADICRVLLAAVEDQQSSFIPLEIENFRLENACVPQIALSA